LKDERFDLQQTISSQTSQITEMRISIENMERERSQRLIDGDRMSGEITMLNEKIRSLEEDIRIKISDFDASQVEIRSLRESNSNLDIQIQSL
jgi:chromosome segregation ATPase